jgi:hypothetical protein
LDNTSRTIDKAVAIVVIGLLLAVGRGLIQFGGIHRQHFTLLAYVQCTSANFNKILYQL